MNATASQIRQDFNNFGGFGQQGYGYNVEYLHTEIGKILGLDMNYKLIIIGVGNLGQALANYTGFEKRGFQIIGIFDINPQLTGIEIGNNKIRSMDELEYFVKNNKVHIATLTLPKAKATKVASDLFSWGVSAFWNFASIDLQLPSSAIVENVHLSENLMRLSYEFARAQK
jgi:redox-sensing transcriptional repressor